MWMGKLKVKAENSIKEAINLHQLHIDKPKTATLSSQEKLMKLLKKHQKWMES